MSVARVRVRPGFLPKEVFMAFDIAPPSLVACIWNFFRECIVKEFRFCLRHGRYRVLFWLNPRRYHLNPTKVQPPERANQTAEVVLLVHGEGSHPSVFFPLAKAYHKAGVQNVYTIDFLQASREDVSSSSIVACMEEISKLFFASGYAKVEFCLVGHSLGAINGSKQIWREMVNIENVSVSMMISIAGRLKYVPNSFAWFCEEEKPEIEKTYQAIEENPDKVKLYTIWGDRDEIVPRESVHIQGKRNQECTVEGYGHLGVIFAPVTHKQAVVWTKKWGER